MKTLLVAGLVVLVNSAAFAEDFKYSPASTHSSPYNWSGFYLGLNAGGGAGSIGTTDNSITTGGALVGLSPTNFDPPLTFGGADTHATFSGPLGGVQAGYDWQSGALVWGLRGSLSVGDLASSDDFYATPVEGPHYQSLARIESFGTMVGRLGVARDNVLFFADGGLAAGSGTAGLTITGGGPAGPTGDSFSDTEHRTMMGYAVGAGIEVGLTQNLSAELEYQYVDFGSTRYDFSFAGSDGSTATTTADTALHAVRAGLNFRF